MDSLRMCLGTHLKGSPEIVLAFCGWLSQEQWRSGVVRLFKTDLKQLGGCCFLQF